MAGAHGLCVRSLLKIPYIYKDYKGGSAMLLSRLYYIYGFFYFTLL